MNIHTRRAVFTDHYPFKKGSRKNLCQIKDKLPTCNTGHVPATEYCHFGTFWHFGRGESWDFRLMYSESQRMCYLPDGSEWLPGGMQRYELGQR